MPQNTSINVQTIVLEVLEMNSDTQDLGYSEYSPFIMGMGLRII